MQPTANERWISYVLLTWKVSPIMPWLIWLFAAVWLAMSIAAPILGLSWGDGFLIPMMIGITGFHVWERNGFKRVFDKKNTEIESLRQQAFHSNEAPLP
jgi:O-antigen ligase